MVRDEGTLHFTNWACLFISNNTLNSSFFKQLQILQTSSTKHITLTYKEHIKNLNAAFENAKALCLASYQEYLAKYSNYQTICKKIESLGEQLFKDPSKQEKIQSELDQHRIQCIEVEEEAAKAHSNYYQRVREFQVATENMAVDFEGYEREFFENIQNLIRKFVEILNELSDSYLTLAEAAESDMTRLQQIIQEDKNAQDCPREKVSMIVDEFSQPPALKFDIFEYLPWNIVFAGELHSSFATVKAEYQSKTDYFKVKANETVKIIKDGLTALVESEETGLRGKVPSSNLKYRKDIKRKVLKVEEDFNDETYSIQKGQYVLWMSDDGQNARCKTVDGQIINIPLAKTSEAVKEKKQ
ncbi:hypothetical protein GPJ56_003846 [Histomonas meleagridis]|uniref:uncharacterized protein n=1 Tax=Histomonas meleagridis TaxID=135588 RepID=UPI00355ACD55|nr:hypothetical protein GPJ56_003846 [Histomonas meleagridis]KAH0805304.1 hypothetical protein GO595_002249 [Histomonas meleagridis]